MTDKNPSSAEREESMRWVQKEMVDPFDDEEITGDHRTIVELYKYCRTLEAENARLDKENTSFAEEALLLRHENRKMKAELESRKESDTSAGAGSPTPLHGGALPDKKKKAVTAPADQKKPCCPDKGASGGTGIPCECDCHKPQQKPSDWIMKRAMEIQKENGLPPHMNDTTIAILDYLDAHDR